MTKVDEIASPFREGFATEELEMKKLHLPIIIEIDEDGYYIVTCPIFKGCHSYGETIDEALKNIKEVIEMCLEETKNFLSYNKGLNNVI